MAAAAAACKADMKPLLKLTSTRTEPKKQSRWRKEFLSTENGACRSDNPYTGKKLQFCRQECAHVIWFGCGLAGQFDSAACVPNSGTGLYDCSLLH